MNLPREEEAPVESQALTLYKDEDMENNIGDADATEVSPLIVLLSRSELNFTNITSFHVCYFSDLTT